jgi:hypothetical protein
MEIKLVSEVHLQLLNTFMEATKDDVRINTAHISLYVSLTFHWQKRDYKNPLSVFRHEILPFCKISGTATYHRSMKELHEFGYIRYVPSYNHFLGSLVYFIKDSP